ncbi:hypothetical protein [Silvanigrella aquatica]|uniref:Uncharacterized protein n=1 Tax=Silvanigrella aquatica TaxID=1915309 RepID=A0A1L4D093_9BACT|nr:hypothetical protein [Silvanigrella aquatica]APJ03607.1 hypothetical protein AXG55_06680 [Silvanigrella aquatica]
MSQIFRIATSQAIREIIEESAVEGRFGLILTDDGIEKIAQRVVDLFEMTLELRAKTQAMFAGMNNSQAATPAKQTASKNNFLNEEKAPFPKTKNAAEIYDFGQKKRNDLDSLPMPLVHDVKLPRTRFGLSLEEKERLRK